MSSAKITLSSFYTWFNTASPQDDLFKSLDLPEGIDKDTLVGNILMTGGEFEVAYADPYFMQNLIGVWSKKWYRTFTKWVDALSIDYNPLENYDRMEEWEDENKGTLTNTRTHNNQDKRTLNTTDTTTYNSTDTTDIDGTTTNTEEVSAYDSSSYQPSKQVTTDEDTTNTLKHTGHDDLKKTGTDTIDYSGTIKDDGGSSGNAKHKGRIHGNIGVTTSQQMLQSELDLAQWNLYEHITDLFLKEFVIGIYS